MRRLSNTFLTIGAVLAFVFAGVLILTSIIFFVIGSPAFAEMFREGLEENANYSGEDINTAVLAFQLAFTICGVAFIMVGVLRIPSGVIAILAKKNPTKGLLIANIVLGALCGCYFNIAGGVIGLIYNGKLARREVKVVDAQ